MSTDPFAAFEAAAARSRDEAPPVIDVTDRVIGTLRELRARPGAVEPEYWYVGVGSLLAAGVAAFLWVRADADAFLPLVQPFVTGFQ